MCSDKPAIISLHDFWSRLISFDLDCYLHTHIWWERRWMSPMMGNTCRCKQRHSINVVEQMKHRGRKLFRNCLWILIFVEPSYTKKTNNSQECVRAEPHTHGGRHTKVRMFHLYSQVHSESFSLSIFELIYENACATAHRAVYENNKLQILRTINCYEVWFSFRWVDGVRCLDECHLGRYLLRIGTIWRRCGRVRGHNGGHGDWCIVCWIGLIDRHDVNNWDSVRRCARLENIFFLQQWRIQLN